MTPQNDEKHKRTANADASTETQHKKKGRRGMSPVAWLLSAALAVTLGIALYCADKGRWVNTVWWGFAFCVVVCAGTLYALLPLAREKDHPATPSPEPNAAQAALDKLASQGDAALRPYLGVSAVIKKRMEVDKTVWIVIEFTNNGKTPADGVEVRGKLQKLPRSAQLDRNYTGAGFEVVSREHVNTGNTIAADFISQNATSANVLTFNDLMELTTERSYRLVVHGIIRYRSPHIASGADETPFCYEFDPESGEMVACRVKPESLSVSDSDRRAIERAQIAVTNFRGVPEQIVDGIPQYAFIRFTVENAGRTKGTLESIRYYLPPHIQPIQQAIVPGHPYQATTTADLRKMPANNNIITVPFHGVIAYTDVFKVTRRYRFEADLQCSAAACSFGPSSVVGWNDDLEKD